VISSFTRATLQSRDGPDVRRGQPIISRVSHIGRVWQLVVTPPELDHEGKGITGKAMYWLYSGSRPFDDILEDDSSLHDKMERCAKRAEIIDSLPLTGQSPVTWVVPDRKPGTPQHFVIFLDTGKKASENPAEPETKPAEPETKPAAPPAGPKSVKL
jgi:hypothetical protein